jgi:Protein of unknown function (DUF3046)
MTRHGRSRIAGLIGRRTLKIAMCACDPLLPTYLITTHQAKRSPHLRAFRVPPQGAGSLRRTARAIPATSRQYPGDVRQTEFWSLMRTQFGDVYAQSLAKDFVFGNLGERTVERALADGVDAKVVWRTVCDTFNVPDNLR